MTANHCSLPFYISEILHFGEILGHLPVAFELASIAPGMLDMDF
jgi:hypothetical protein